tara:strand:+ start:182 stop:1492 length:1311 start_codon:yes stop_codon:yes gene_type:complete
MRRLHPRDVKPEELPGIEFWNILTGTMGGMYMRLVFFFSPFFVYYAEACGFEEYHFGLRHFFFYMTVVFQLFSSFLERKYENRKKLWLYLVVPGRAVFVLYALTLSPSWVIFVLVVGMILSNLADPIWFGWYFDYMPAEVRGRFWSKRTVVVSIGVLIATLMGSAIMEAASAEQKLYACKWIIGIGVLLGVLDALLHAFFIPEPRKKKTNDLLAELDILRKNRKFRKWVLILSLWSFSTTTMGPACLPFIMDDLKLGENFLTLVFTINVMMFVGIVVGGYHLGKLIDECGAKPVLLISHFVWALVPLFYYFATPGNAFYMVGACFLVCGVFVAAGAATAWEKVKGELTPEDKTMHIAVLTFFVAIASALGALLEAWFVHRYGVYNVFLLSLVCRCFAFLGFLKLEMVNDQKTVPETFRKWWERFDRSNGSTETKGE